MEISTSTNIVAFTPGRQRNPMEFCIRECAKGGYRILDINFCEAMNPWSRMRQDDWEEYIRELVKIGEECGVVFRQSHLPYYDIFKNPEPDKTMELLIERSIIASAMLGVRWAVTHPGTYYADYSASREKNLFYYEKHLQTAKSYGIGICLENDFGIFPGESDKLLYCANITELTELVDTFSDPEYMAVCYDFGHANLCPQPDHYRNLLTIGSRLKALHVQDNHGLSDEHLLPFHGNINWKTCMEALVEIGYKGNLTYEVQEFGRFLPNDRKHLVVEYSWKIGDLLLGYYENAINR